MVVMRFIADFHLHSKYSRATSQNMNLETLNTWAKLKGIRLLGTGDFTHPTYLLELKTKLESLGNGLFVLKDDPRGTYFILTCEVSNVFQYRGKTRRIHNIIFAPNLEVVEKINARLRKLGKLAADGRPTFGFPAKEMAKLVLDTSGDCLIVPAHAWTPWYSVFGANSGFDSLEECFEEQTPFISAIETGLSSDPQMNWRLSALDDITLISNSDAHSPNRIGREANIFQCPMDYETIIDGIRKKALRRIVATIEFFPQEGKYHYDGHRECGIRFSPEETRRHKTLCPVCGKRLTVGVMSRVEELADRPEGFVPPTAIPAIHLVPLEEIIAESLGHGRDTNAVRREYMRMVEIGGSEFEILLERPPEELTEFATPKILESILRVRQGQIHITPGYDGVYGKIQISPQSDEGEKDRREQLSLF